MWFWYSYVPEPCFKDMNLIVLPHCACILDTLKFILAYFKILCLENTIILEI